MERLGFLNRLIGGTAALVAMAAVMATSAQDAEAGFLLRLTDSATNTTVLIQDNTGAGVATGSGMTTVADVGIGAGVIVFYGSIGGTVWDVNITSGVSKPVIGVGPQKLHLTSMNVSSMGSGTLTVELTDTGYTSSASSPYFTVGIGGVTGGSVTLNHAAIDPNNAQFASTVNIAGGGLGPFSGAYSSSSSQAVNVGAGSPFSMTLSATVTHTGAGQTTSLDADISVPEPGSLALFGIGLLGLGFLCRRRSSHLRTGA